MSFFILIRLTKIFLMGQFYACPRSSSDSGTCKPRSNHAYTGLGLDPEPVSIPVRTVPNNFFLIVRSPHFPQFGPTFNFIFDNFIILF